MNVRNVMRQFSKKELLDIAKELDIDVDFNITSKSIITEIVTDLNDAGVPAEEDCSNLLENFLEVTGFVDVEETDEVDTVEVVEVEQVKEVVEIDVTKLQCFSFHADRDPACRKCKVAEQCKIKKLSILPDCYGKLFNEYNDECKLCIENVACRELSKNKE